MVSSGSSQTRPPPVDLPNFSPLALVTSGTVSPCADFPGHPADEVETGGDVAPLVGAADLQPAVVTAQEFEVVGRLQQLVAELGVGEATADKPGAHESLSSMALTGKCLPMSRRKSMADSGAVHSRLLTSSACAGPGSRSPGSGAAAGRCVRRCSRPRRWSAGNALWNGRSGHRSARWLRRRSRSGR